MKKRTCLDASGSMTLLSGMQRNTTPRAAVIGRRSTRSSPESSTSQKDCSSQEERVRTSQHVVPTIDNEFNLPVIQATIRAASKGKQKDVYDRSSVEVEQILPPIEPVHDPRNLYASDSPVIEDPDSDKELYKSAEEFAKNIGLEGQVDGAAGESNSGSNACFLFDLYWPLLKGLNQPRSLRPPQQLSSQFTAPISHPSSPSLSPVSHPPLLVASALPRNPDRTDQRQGTLGGFSVCGLLSEVLRLVTPFSGLQ